jgi:DNA-binding CsgD family transcriptional regulator
VAKPAAFVGREGELSRLLSGLGGDARLLLVVGDAGIGKTRFAAEAMARAAADGLVTLRGDCLPLASTLPLLPVAAALGELSALDRGTLLAAALDAAPEYVRAEVGRLLPRLGPGTGTDPASRGEEWRRERLFSAVAELLAAAAGQSRVVLVIEDVHWADSATLDLLTFLARPGDPGALTVVATCRGDESPLPAHVAAWLAHARGNAGVEQIGLGPLSRSELASQAAGLLGGPVPPRVVDELYARAEGNPFFTEQLIAAAQADPQAGGLHVRAGLPARLAELLAARASRCAGNAGAVLAGLAVAGRPLGEDLLAAVSDLDLEGVRAGLRELASARLLAEDTGGRHRARHALLADAVAAGLLPGERAALHERAARAMQTIGDQSLAAEVAAHWQAAGNPGEELPARIAAAAAAERVFCYAQAAAHWMRAIELCQAQPTAASAAGIDVPWLYVQAIDALSVSGDGVGAGIVAEEAYGRFAGHPDAATAAVVHERAAFFRGADRPAAGLPLIEEALRLFGRAPPSAKHAEAWIDYATIFVLHGGGRQEASAAALNRALEIAEAAGATALIPRILGRLAHNAFLRGQIGEGFVILDRGRAVAEQSAGHSGSAVSLAIIDSDALLRLGQFQGATDVALRGLEAARRAGRDASFPAATLAANAAEAMIASGRTDEAAALIDPLTDGPRDPGHLAVTETRVEIDLLRGDIDAAAGRAQQITTLLGRIGHVDAAREVAQRWAELALWAGRPGDALDEVQRSLALFQVPDLTIFCGRLLAAGMRACADLAGQARARRDIPAAHAAESAAAELAAWVHMMGGAPFADHPFVAAIPAERATWDAERTRLAGASDPSAWAAVAKTWQGLGCPHRAGYALWRQAEAQLDAGQPPAAAAAALHAATAAARGHAPLLAQIRALAQRARIPLHVPDAPAREEAPPALAPPPYQLTGRELDVLRLLAAGRTNAQIGAELYISPSTAGVHVSSILRKLGVSGRAQAAALAERAGLLESPQS